MSGSWLAGKVGAAVLTLIFVLIFNFFLFRVMGDPTDPARAAAQLDARGDREAAQRLRHRQADPGPVRRLRGRHAALDLGISQRSRESVWDEIMTRCPGRSCWSAPGRSLATLIGTWLGVVAATRRGKKSDDGLLGFSLFTYAAPEYWIGIILILVFAVGYRSSPPVSR